MPVESGRGRLRAETLQSLRCPNSLCRVAEGRFRAVVSLLSGAPAALRRRGLLTQSGKVGSAPFRAQGGIRRRSEASGIRRANLIPRRAALAVPPSKGDTSLLHFQPLRIHPTLSPSKGGPRDDVSRSTRCICGSAGDEVERRAPGFIQQLTPLDSPSLDREGDSWAQNDRNGPVRSMRVSPLL